MFKIFTLAICGYFLYQWWFNPKQLPGKSSDDEEYADYEEID